MDPGLQVPLQALLHDFWKSLHFSFAPKGTLSRCLLTQGSRPGYILTTLHGWNRRFTNNRAPAFKANVRSQTPEDRGPASDARISPFLSENGAGPVSCATR